MKSPPIVSDDPAADFTQEDFVLNFRPTIKFIEPEIETDFIPAEDAVSPTTIEDARKRTEEAAKAYRAIGKLADITQKRLDNRVVAAGNVSIQTDPIQDSMIVAAIKREFPEEDGSRITYEMYRHCLDKITRLTENAPVLQDSDIVAAQADPLRTNFGGLNNPAGSNRPEISSPANLIKPIDLKSFQSAAVQGIFKMMVPLILDLLNPF